MTVFKFFPSENSIPLSETVRYMGIKGSPSPEDNELALSACQRLASSARPSVCYTICKVTLLPDGVDLGFGKIPSISLKKLLSTSTEAVLFAATIGIEADRLIASAKTFSVARALAFDAAGTAFIESVCDEFCEYLRKSLLCGKNFTMRFSPGYGDVPLTLQKDIFNVLNCPKNIALTLTESFLMMPSKSVTAICGITSIDAAMPCIHKCASCTLKTCIYRNEDSK